MLNPHTFYTDLVAEAARAGTNLTQLCAEAGVPRATLTNWRTQPPKTLVLMCKLYDALAAKQQPENAGQ